MLQRKEEGDPQPTGEADGVLDGTATHGDHGGDCQSKGQKDVFDD